MFCLFQINNGIIEEIGGSLINKPDTMNFPISYLRKIIFPHCFVQYVIIMSAFVENSPFAQIVVGGGGVT